MLQREGVRAAGSTSGLISTRWDSPSETQAVLESECHAGKARMSSMMSKIIRIAMLCLVAVSLAMLSGCCGTCWGNQCTVYQHPCPACYGLHYSGSCTCTDDCRDRINQLTDIFLP
jgi:hypothetical protein